MADLLPQNVIDPVRNNGSISYLDYAKNALKWAAAPLLGGPDVALGALASGVGAGISKAGEGAKAVGESIKKTTTSVSSGLKWGIAALVVLVVLFVAAPYVGLLRRN